MFIHIYYTLQYIQLLLMQLDSFLKICLLEQLYQSIQDMKTTFFIIFHVNAVQDDISAKNCPHLIITYRKAILGTFQIYNFKIKITNAFQ